MVRLDTSKGFAKIFMMDQIDLESLELQVRAFLDRISRIKQKLLSEEEIGLAPPRSLQAGEAL
jgi:hypothetical protein